VLYEHGGWLWVALVGTLFPVLALARFLTIGRPALVSMSET
jgi:hypothetical protein